MNEIKFTTIINASKKTVWNTLWNDATFREWASVIDPGTYMVGDLIAGNEVQYISSENGYGVTSLVQAVTQNEYLLLAHQADTQDTGAHTRENEWTGGTESYKLTENEGVTTLTTTIDVPAEQEEYFTVHYPLALQKVKELAERKEN